MRTHSLLRPRHALSNKKKLLELKGLPWYKIPLDLSDSIFPEFHRSAFPSDKYFFIRSDQYLISCLFGTLFL